jgi:hypothetical protein
MLGGASTRTGNNMGGSGSGGVNVALRPASCCCCAASAMGLGAGPGSWSAAGFGPEGMEGAAGRPVPLPPVPLHCSAPTLACGARTAAAAGAVGVNHR